MNKVILLIILIISCVSCISKQNLAYESQNPLIEIIIDQSAAPMVSLAAHELKYHWERIYDSEIHITHARNPNVGNAIYIGRSEYTEKISSNTSSLFEQGGYIIKSVSDGVVLLGDDTQFIPSEPFGHFRKDDERVLQQWDSITGDFYDNFNKALFKGYNKELGIWEYDGKGSLYAVYWYLKYLGVRWYLPGHLGEVVPSLHQVNLTGFDEEIVPSFQVRQLGFYSRRFFNAPIDDIKYYLRLGLNNGYATLGNGPIGHGMLFVHSREQFRELHSSERIFAIHNGRRDDSQRGRGRPCLTSESFFKHHTNFIRKIFDTYDIPTLSVMPPDAYSVLCEEARCQKHSSDDQGNEGKLSDYVWNYVDRIGREIQKTHPTKKLTCYAFGSYLLPPLSIGKLNNNILVGICKTRSKLNTEIKQREYFELISSWEDKTENKLLFWDYYLTQKPSNSKEYTVPFIYPDIISLDLKKNQNRILGEYVEVYRSFNSKNPLDELAYNHINVFLTAALYNDISVNTEELLEEYYTMFYGETSPIIKKAFELAQQMWKYNNVNEEERNLFSHYVRLALKDVKPNSIIEKRINLILRNTN